MADSSLARPSSGSLGGSVNDSIALGRRWRNLGTLTTVGIGVETNTA
jgi:hypothetical protein